MNAWRVGGDGGTFGHRRIVCGNFLQQIGMLCLRTTKWWMRMMIWIRTSSIRILIMIRSRIIYGRDPCITIRLIITP